MKENSNPSPSGRISILLLSGLIATMLILVAVNGIAAQGSETLTPVLDGSSVFVDKLTAQAGTVLHYTIVISNSGMISASDVSLTSRLDSSLTYISGSVVRGGGVLEQIEDILEWRGNVLGGEEVLLEIDAVIDEDVPVGTQIDTLAELAFADAALLLAPASTEIESKTSSLLYTFLPIIYNPPPTVDLLQIAPPLLPNDWTVDWTVSDSSSVTQYQVQEDHSSSFSNPTNIYVNAPATLLARSKGFSTANLYFYRVRAIGPWGNGVWSNTEEVATGYFDDFGNSATGWAMRREDTDTVANQVYYRDGNLVLEMDSSYDYVIAAPMAPAPQAPYRIQASVRLAGVDNLHSYGFVFGGDWNGQQCPNGDYSSCFNTYYRLSAIYSGDLDDRMTMILKRIDYHTPDDNVGRGPDLIGPKYVDVNPPASGWQHWEIEVRPTGQIKIFVDGVKVGSINDTTLIHQPFFGAFASTDEYTGLEAEFDWYQVGVVE